MASLIRESRDGRKSWRVQFYEGDVRRSLGLGSVSKRIAEGYKRHVEELTRAKDAGHRADAESIRWADTLGSRMRERLVALQLIEPANPKLNTDAGRLLGPFIDAYVTGRTDTASTTQTNYRQSRRLLCEYFGEDKPMRSITAADADRWRRWLLSRPVKKDKDGNTLKTMATASVSKHVKRTKTMFTEAVRDRLLDASPFADQKGSSEANKERHHFVDRQTTATVLKGCPDDDWRMIFALARFAGMRCPSEVTALTWADVLWDQNRLRIDSTKTGLRFCPIFPELRPLLEAAFDAALDGSIYVVGRYGGNADANLSTQLKRIVTGAGCVPWQKTFINLRSTRRTELQERFPSHVVDAWLGHSTKTAETHYLQVTADHFAAGATTLTGNLDTTEKTNGKNAETKCRAVRRAIPADPGRSTDEVKTKKPRQIPAFDGLGLVGASVTYDPYGVSTNEANTGENDGNTKCRAVRRAVPAEIENDAAELLALFAGLDAGERITLLRFARRLRLRNADNLERFPGLSNG